MPYFESRFYFYLRENRTSHISDTYYLTIICTMKRGCLNDSRIKERKQQACIRAALLFRTRLKAAFSLPMMLLLVGRLSELTDYQIQHLRLINTFSRKTTLILQFICLLFYFGKASSYRKVNRRNKKTCSPFKTMVEK